MKKIILIMILLIAIRVTGQDSKYIRKGSRIDTLKTIDTLIIQLPLAKPMQGKCYPLEIVEKNLDIFKKVFLL